MKAKRKKLAVKLKPLYPFTVIEPPKRHGHPWHPSEAAWVTQAWESGLSVNEIAAVCNRTRRAIEYFLQTGDNFASTEVSVVVSGRRR